jgi:hypothetical protein
MVACLTAEFPRNGFPALSLPRAETHVRLYVNCPLLPSDNRQNRNVSTNFSEAPQYQI